MTDPGGPAEIQVRRRWWPPPGALAAESPTPLIMAVISLLCATSVVGLPVVGMSWIVWIRRYFRQSQGFEAGLAAGLLACASVLAIAAPISGGV